MRGHLDIVQVRNRRGVLHDFPGLLRVRVGDYVEQLAWTVWDEHVHDEADNDRASGALVACDLDYISHCA